jgi:hypothetical protein
VTKPLQRGGSFRPTPASLARGRLLAALAVALPLWFSCGDDAVPISPGEVRLSLLAVGDTGWPVLISSTLSGQMSVANGMVAEDRRSPVDALIFLGDNFYPHGLLAKEMVSRLRENLVEPYCRFVELKGWASHKVADACPAPSAERHPVPIYAVLGNHDYDEHESPALQVNAVAWFVSNWHMPEGQAETFELGEGVSLILFQSAPLFQGDDASRLRRAIREARGPWRILAAHRPLKTPLRRKSRRLRPYAEAYVRAVEQAIQEAGVPVHLYLSGHEHNLQVISSEPPAPPLQIVAGSGASVRTLKFRNPQPRFLKERFGFVRVDLAGGGDEARLMASLFTTPRLSLSSSARPSLVARWSVDLKGQVREESIRRGGESR